MPHPRISAHIRFECEIRIHVDLSRSRKATLQCIDSGSSSCGFISNEKMHKVEET